MPSSDTVYRLAPYTYIHVLDVTTNITRVETGPLTYIRQDNEKVVLGPEPMITVPSRHYVIIRNPALRDDAGEIVYDAGEGPFRQVKLRHAENQVRLAQDPFPLYPGEQLEKGVTPLTIVPADSAIRLKAILDHTGEDGTARVAGDEYLFEGPGTYTPRVEESVVETIRATIILPNQALKVRARKETKSRDGVMRVTGAEWLVRKVGAYLPGAYEEVTQLVEAFVLTDKKALHVRAMKNFEDEYGNKRRNGDEWLITLEDTDAHIPAVEEEVVSEVSITVLTNREYTVIQDPCDDRGRPQLGCRKLVQGPAKFFLKPGESLEAGIRPVYVLGENEALILSAREAFVDNVDGKEINRKPGDKWMIRGPTEYVPNIQSEVLDTHRAIPLDDNEGIYVRDTQTGQVKMERGKTYMLTENEELWSKDLPPGVEELLANPRDALADRSNRDSGNRRSNMKRDKSRVVSLRVPHNAAVQIYDYKLKKARVVFGPELVMLGPEEQFTQLSLSGGKPKRPNEISSLCLLLGPDFCTDIITIETADHARLQIQLSYNWHFEVDKSDVKAAAKLFSVPDFIGDMCKAVASRVRGAVAGVQFDDFHKNSAKIIRSSVFGLYSQAEADKGVGELGKVRGFYRFEQNNLYITSIDIQSAEPVDQRTRDALQKSVQLAIEITTNSQEAAARHEAQRLEQEAKGRLERQKIQDEADAEEARQKLLELQAQSAAVESSGQAKAEAQSRAEAQKIEGEAAVEQARLRAEAVKIEAESEIERLEAARNAEINFIREQDQLEIQKNEALVKIEQEKFKSMVEAIGKDTLKAMAQAGPEMQVKLLQGLGLQSTLITDGKSPINLFQTAKGLIGGGLDTTTSSTDA
eukprot:m.19130 g.19130  ORF g.19130 m.19130 type:complete len:865 (-) comp6493_c0_seq1:72-2666(-)